MTTFSSRMVSSWNLNLERVPELANIWLFAVRSDPPFKLSQISLSAEDKVDSWS